MFRSLPLILLLAALLSALAAPVQAKTRTQLENDVIAWAGTGPRTAFVVVDFNESPALPAQFVFGCRFGADGKTTITALQALNTLAAQTPLDIVEQNGGFIVKISFTHNNTTYVGDGINVYPPWWSYWESNDFTTTWTSPWDYGAAGHIMSDGEVSGWAFSTKAWPANPLEPNGPLYTPARQKLEAEAMHWSGTGPLTAFLVVDFNETAAAPGEVVFAHRFGNDDQTTITGLALLQAVAAATPLDIVEQSSGFIVKISYSGNGRNWVGDGINVYPPWWSYWESNDSAQTWVSPWDYGAAGHIITDGEVAGWGFSTKAWPDNPLEPNGPRLTSARLDLERDVVYWTGNGPQTAFIVVDFDESSTRSAEFVFGYRFGNNGVTTVTALAALQAVAAASPLDISEGNGGFIQRITFSHGGTVYDGNGINVYPPWWSYWESQDLGASWISPWDYGAAGHIMSDGEVSGWGFSFKAWPDNPLEPNGPRYKTNQVNAVQTWARYE